MRPISSISAPSDAPMISGKSTVDANSGTTAMRANGVQKYAARVQYTKSQWGSNVVPMPTVRNTSTYDTQDVGT